LVAATVTYEVGLTFNAYHKGKISWDFFIERTKVIVVSNLVGAATSTAAASVGAAIGTAICPGLGTIIVGAIGAAAGFLVG
jgi:outer membrane lipoprotein SlyB